MKYKIVDCFNVVNDVTVLVLDKKIEHSRCKFVSIEGRHFDFDFNSVPTWITIHSKENFRGKSLEFV